LTGGKDQGESLRELIARLIDSGKAYLRAELFLVRKTVKVRLIEAKYFAAFAMGAGVLGLAGVIALVAALGLFLGRWLGPAGGMAVAGLIALVAAGLLTKYAVDHFLDWKRKK
jgi:hypothetical protein